MQDLQSSKRVVLHAAHQTDVGGSCRWQYPQGACESVVDPEENVPEFEVEETRASKKGLMYASATGEEIPNLGGIAIPMVTLEKY